MSTSTLSKPDVIELLRARTLAKETFEELLYRAAHPELSRYPNWGIPQLQTLTKGIGPWYIGFVGEQKYGKSIWLNHCVRQLSDAKKRYVHIGLEMDHYMNGIRLFSNLSKITMSRLAEPEKLGEEEWAKLTEARRQLSEWTGVFNVGANNITRIDQIIELIDPEYIVIDYLGLISPERGSVRREELTQISRHFKQLTLPETVSRDEVEHAFTVLVASIAGWRWLLGDENTDYILALFDFKWSEHQASLNTNDEQAWAPRRKRGLLTASQTSKEAQRGKLDKTAPKDSQALFEDCDLGLVGNWVLDENEKIIPYLRELTVPISRISDKCDPFVIGMNTSIATIFDPTEILQRAPKTNLGGMRF